MLEIQMHQNLMHKNKKKTVKINIQKKNVGS